MLCKYIQMRECELVFIYVKILFLNTAVKLSQLTKYTTNFISI